MNRLGDEHIHLLLDEPIFVLAAHGDQPAQHEVEEEQPQYTGGNEQGICLFTGPASEEDIIFLFKGLNALNIEEKDVAIFPADYESVKDYPQHRKRLRFSEHVNLETAFKVVQQEGKSILNCIPLAEIRHNQDFKRQFWEALKAMFK